MSLLHDKRLEIFRGRIRAILERQDLFIVELSMYYLKVIISRRVDLKGARSYTRVRSGALAGTVKRGGSSSTSFPAKSDATSRLESRRYRDNWMGRVLLALALSLRDYDKPQKQPLMVSLAIARIYIPRFKPVVYAAPILIVDAPPLLRKYACGTSEKHRWSFPRCDFRLYARYERVF